MENTFNKIPFLRLTVALASGIFLASLFKFDSTLCFFGIVGIIVCLLIIQKWYNFFLSPIFGLLTFVLFVLFGSVIFTEYNKTTIVETQGTLIGTVLETPQEKPNSYKSLIQLHSCYSSDTLERTHENILVYFEKSIEAKQLKLGSQIIFDTSPEYIENNGNPYEFDYKKYLARQHIYRQVYLSSESWEPTTYKYNNLKIRAETIRDKLLIIYRAQEIGERETEILSALTLGYKRELDRETKRIFSSAGAMHILAVSGLHVGILFFAFSFIFGFLKKRKAGKLIYHLILIALLWSYAFITGLSPSVMRACTMFSLITIANNIHRRANIYNTLAASAFLLLLINPNNLFEVGFQLSYMAVFGIVYLQPRLAAIWPVKNKIALFFWNLITVSVAAQIATFPLSAYYFNQFPTYFLLSNIVVIPAAMVLIPLGIGLLAFSSVPLLAEGISFLVKWIIKTVYFTLSSIESFPYSTPDVMLRRPELLFVLAILFSVFLFIKNKNVLYIKSSLLFVFLLTLSILFSGYKQFNQHEIIVLNSKEPVVCFISAKNLYVVSALPLSPDDYIYSSIQDIKIGQRIKNVRFLNMNESFHDNYILLDQQRVIFEGKKVLIEDDKSTPNEQNSGDIYIAGTNGFKPVLPKTDSCYIVQYYPGKNTFANPDQIHILSAQGAFVSSW
ncbi:ComEC/Rec2 family competence protein [Draconibacterium sp. IB214405]|uniref:ComEC/Rec2 family competence protein n=1 Tax=Draconibacterium sp. IB214405 TaxID=3097352 RepID=UPI002A1288E5|nr:ComEC/Rec2 family competence protein [Draconibacterium sp. IB214405]MDX8340920.1 ComEC/Rec2 family competence protein [Draconibacterium sp. IB214405]